MANPRRVTISTRVTPEFYESFSSKAEADGLIKADAFHALLIAYTNGDIIITPPVKAIVTQVR